MTERSLSQLIKDIRDDSKALAQEEAALAKSEVTTGAKNLGIGSGLAVVALYLLYLSSFMAIFVLSALFHELLNWPWWASFLIVFGILVVIGGILIAIAIPLFKKGNPTPKAAIERGKSVKDALLRALKNPTGPRV